MTHQDKLIKFVKLKNEVIENETGIKYIKDADIENVKTWDETECKFVYEELLYNINNLHKHGLTRYTCIWCIIKDIDCCDCNYGKINGMCNELDSLYREYDTDEVVELLTNDKYKEMIREIENN